VNVNGAITPFLKEARLEGTKMSKKRSWGLHVGLFSVLCLAVVGLIARNAFAAPDMPSSGEKKNVKLVGYNDLQGRETLQITVNGNWAFAGHLNDFYNVPPKQKLNPITGFMEWNGTSILEISNPARPKLVWHIPNDISANSRSVQVVYNYGSPPRDYLIRNSEGGGVWKYQIFDITDRGTNPINIHLVGEILGSPPNSCGPGCGGLFTNGTHKGWWCKDSGLFYSASNEPGFVSNHLVIHDLADPANPVFVSRGWIPGQKVGDTEPAVGNFHHPVVDEANHRLYSGFRGTGEVVIYDITNPATPTIVSYVGTQPPFRATHTAAPVVYDVVQDIEEEALPRKYLLVCDEGGGGDYTDFPNVIRPVTFMFDISDERNPFNVSIWQVPSEPFRFKGGRFGPHNFHETVNGKLNDFKSKIVWFAYFNAGARVVDISNPYQMKEVGYYIPEPTANSHPITPINAAKPEPTVIQTNDVDVDSRGLAYVVDRTGAGLHVLEYTGNKK